MTVATQESRQAGSTPAQLTSAASSASFNHAQKRGLTMKRIIASILLSLAFGWLATAAIAEDEAKTETTAAADTTTAEPATDAASTDTPTTDDTTAAAPAEPEKDK
jgi:hypothetical protein